MKFIIIIIIAFGIIFCCTQILRSKPAWLVKLYCDIWERPYPTKHRIDFIGTILAIVFYISVLIYIVIFDK
jgi:hypothetical protein